MNNKKVIFRAISIETSEAMPKSVRAGKWVYGYPIFDWADCSLHCDNQHNGELLVFFAWIDEKHEYDEVKVDPDTIGMYIWTNDATGKMIFDGDIVERAFSKTILDDGRPKVVRERAVGVVKWHDDPPVSSGRWVMEISSDYEKPVQIGFSARSGQYTKVIGSIYDEKLNKEIED